MAGFVFVAAVAMRGTGDRRHRQLFALRSLRIGGELRVRLNCCRLKRAGYRRGVEFAPIRFSGELS